MNVKRMLSLYGLKWNPFSPELPNEGLLMTSKIEHFAWRVEQMVQEGGFALITGDSGTGKSVALRIVAAQASGAARCRGRRDREASIEKHRFLSRAGRHLRSQAHAVQSLGWIQGTSRALEGPCGFITHPPGPLDRRSPGDARPGSRRAADSLQCRL